MCTRGNRSFPPPKKQGKFGTKRDRYESAKSRPSSASRLSERGSLVPRDRGSPLIN